MVGDEAAPQELRSRSPDTNRTQSGPSVFALLPRIELKVSETPLVWFMAEKHGFFHISNETGRQLRNKETFMLKHRFSKKQIYA